ncbi:MAG: hypothetical protein ACQETB_07590 [Halobacteriota archaeon]
MARTHISALDGESIRYNGDTWEFTGGVNVKRNGEAIHATVRNTDRVGGDDATFRFVLRDPPASINPGNMGHLSARLEPRDGGHYLVVDRNHARNHYRLDNMSYS